jgi:hypothetical protein
MLKTEGNQTTMTKQPDLIIHNHLPPDEPRSLGRQRSWITRDDDQREDVCSHCGGTGIEPEVHRTTGDRQPVIKSLADPNAYNRGRYSDWSKRK